MEVKDLLEQEEAFHKLNAELELRTRQLMKNVEASMNKASDCKNWPPAQYLDSEVPHGMRKGRTNYTLPRSPGSSSISDLFDQNIYNDGDSEFRITMRPKSSISNQQKKSNRTVKQFNSKDLESNDLIPASAKGMSAESLARFLKAKGKLLQEELAQTRRDFNNKSDELRRSQQELRNNEEEKLKAQGELSSFREKVKKLEINMGTLAERLQMRDSENSLLKKEIEMLKSDIKKVNHNTCGQDVRLNKAKEETEKLKQLLKQSQINEKEARDMSRKKNDEMLTIVRKLEKQKNDLIAAIKKQISLIENLKKQKKFVMDTMPPSHEGYPMFKQQDKEYVVQCIEEIEDKYNLRIY